MKKKKKKKKRETKKKKKKKEEEEKEREKEKEGEAKEIGRSTDQRQCLAESIALWTANVDAEERGQEKDTQSGTRRCCGCVTHVGRAKQERERTPEGKFMFFCSTWREVTEIPEHLMGVNGIIHIT